MHKITTFLTFKDQAEDALKFYTSVFSNAKTGETQRYGAGAPCPKGSFMVKLDDPKLQQAYEEAGGPA
ncbi:MAG: VOC family protein [Pseudomonadota bacterium]|uniref:VOC family protein n=1 Tax=Polaromonas sp. TaxID=1869339 RepID=UPI0017EF0DE6|nr:VOC family protein [Polaromonas sp.]MBA3594862.1 VOC family protein [Polaromonas sp.]MDQ3271560.1 VOC family protein [Pseudomonadota bacterium]